MGGTEKGGVGGKTGYMYSSSWDFRVQLVGYDFFDSYAVFCWLTNRTQPSLPCGQPPGTSWMRSFERRLNTQAEEGLWCQELLLDDTPQYRSDLIHHGAHWVVLRRSQLCNHPTRLQTCRAVEKAHATDVVGWRIRHCSLCNTFSSPKGEFPPRSWEYKQSIVRSIGPRIRVILWWPRQEVINTLQVVQIDLQTLL